MKYRVILFMTLAMAAASAVGAALAAQHAGTLQPTAPQSAVATVATGLQQADDAAEPDSVWDGIYSEKQAERGSALFFEHCAACHGPDLLGGEMAPALVGGTFLWGWNGLTMGELFERVRTSMPPDDPTSINRTAKADILAFILLRNEFPAGKKDMPDRAEMLQKIMFEAQKPGGGGR